MNYLVLGLVAFACPPKLPELVYGNQDNLYFESDYRKPASFSCYVCKCEQRVIICLTNWEWHFIYINTNINYNVNNDMASHLGCMPIRMTMQPSKVDSEELVFIPMQL